MKHRQLTPLDQRRRLAVKAALRSQHEGPMAVPRKLVWMELEIHETTYGDWLNLDKPDMPTLLDLMAIVSITQNPAPLQAMANCGAGWQVVPDTSEPLDAVVGLEPHAMHVQGLVINHAANLVMAKIVEGDNLITREEAREALPFFRDQKQFTDAAIDKLTRLAGV